MVAPRISSGLQGYYAEIIEDQPELKLWNRTPDTWKRSDLIRADGKQYGVPVIGNGDCFGYFPAAIDANPNGLDEIPWTTFFESDKVKGRVAIDRSWLQSMSETANYMKHHKMAEIDDPADLNKEEARQVAEYLAGRKRAGQFRTIFAAFEEQVQLLSNKEVDMINCWEPATKEANNALGANTVIYAFTVEGYYKWGHGAYVHTKAMHARQRRQYLQGAELLPRWRVSRLPGQAARLCRPEHGPRRRSTRKRMAGRRRMSSS